jgi:hypothetical protein
MRINWGAAIAGVYITFAAATLSFVIFAVGRPVELVSADYYEQSLQHDAHRLAIANAEALGDAVRITGAEDAPAVDIAIGLPVEMPGSMPSSTSGPEIRAVTGTITLYRPSDRTADRVMPLALDAEGRQRVRVEGAAHGRWTVKLAWRDGQREFYRERIVWLP